MKNRTLLWPLAIMAVLGSTSVQAVNFQIFEHPIFADTWVGPDLIQFTPDDVIFPGSLGVNPAGSSASFYEPNPVGFGWAATDLPLGYYSGGWDLHSSLGDQLVVGDAHTLTNYNLTTTFAVYPEPIGSSVIGPVPGTAELDTTLMMSHTVTILPGNMLQSNFAFIDNNELVWTAVGIGGSYVLPGQIPLDLFGPGPVADYYNATIPLLPMGWTFYGGEFIQSTVAGGLGGIFDGEIILSSLAFVSFDAGAAPVPVPAALPLLISGLGGLFAFARRRRVR